MSVRYDIFVYVGFNGIEMTSNQNFIYYINEYIAFAE